MRFRILRKLSHPSKSNTGRQHQSYLKYARDVSYLSSYVEDREFITQKMPIRNRIKVGDYLVTDEESGFIHYASEVQKIWNGQLWHRRNFETRQPQEFVRSKVDPKALSDIRPRPQDAAPKNVITATIGSGTSVPPIVGPASHLYAGPVAGGGGGVGGMKIGTTFKVT